MNAIDSVIATAEILSIFVLCFTSSLVIAYIFLKLVVGLTTRANYNKANSAGIS
jgi:hypothetical protein